MGFREYPSILSHDLRYGSRQFRAAPATAIIAIVSLAVSIGANTTIFSVIHAVLLAAPAYKNPDRLVVLWESNKAKGITRTAVAPATFLEWRNANHSFEDLQLVAPGSPVTVTGGLPERVNIQYATPGLFRVLGVEPAIGRGFTESDLAQGDPLLVSYGYWQRRFGGNTASVGQKIVVNGKVCTLAGVLPSNFHLFDEKADIWLPIKLPDSGSHDYSFRSWLIAVGRLPPSVTLRAAQAEMDLVSSQIALAHPDTNKNWGVRVESIQQAQFGYWKPILAILSGSVLFVLLISCANVANLLLGRLPARTREVAIRVSLGAGRSRIVLQLLHEGVLLGAAGGVVGLLLALWGIRLFVAFAPPDFPLLHAIAINKWVLVFCLAISLCSGLIFSIAPALLGSKTPAVGLSAASIRSTRGVAQRRISSVLVGAQLAISFVLLSGAALMLTSMLKLLQIDAGFRTERVLTMQVFLTGPKYIENVREGVHVKDAVPAFYRQLIEQIEAAPGTQSVGLVSWLPEGGYNTGRRERAFRIMGEDLDKSPNKRTALFNIVSSGYFRTLQIPLLAGRYIDQGDGESKGWVAVVNSAFARRYWPGEDPIGKQLLTDGGVDEKPREVVGVVADVRQNSLEQAPQPEIFCSFVQQPATNFSHGYQNRVHMNIVVKTLTDPESTVAAIRKIAAALDDNQPVYSVRTMSEVVSASLVYRALYTRWLELFAAIALFLAATGVYSVTSQSVSERNKEIGIRIALGSSRRSILALFIQQAAMPILGGSLLGFVGVQFSNRLLTSLLFGVTPDSALVAVVILLLFLTIAVAAVLIPATHATQMDVSSALHYE